MLTVSSGLFLPRITLLSLLSTGEQKEGASNAPFISSGGGSRRQETEPARSRPGAARPATDEPERDEADSSTATAAPAPRQPETATATTSIKKADLTPDSPAEPAMAEPSKERGANVKLVTATERGEGEQNRAPVAATEEEQTSPIDYDATHDSGYVVKEAEQETDDRVRPHEESQFGPSADRKEPSDVTESRNGATGLEGDITEPGAQLTDQSAVGTAQTNDLGTVEAATETTEINKRLGVESSPVKIQPEIVPDHPEENPEYSSVNPQNLPQESPAMANHSPVDRVSIDLSPLDVSTVDPSVLDRSPLDPDPKDAYLPKIDSITKDATSYDDTIENSNYKDFYDVTTEGTISSDHNDKPISYEVIDQPSSYEPSEPISEEVVTELAPFLAVSVAQGVDRIGYVDLSAPTNFQAEPRPTAPPRYNDFTDIQVGTAYFGGLAPAPAQATAPERAPAPDPAPAWAQLGSSGPVSAPAASPSAAPDSDQTGKKDNSPQLQRPAPATKNHEESHIYDYSPWNPIIPAFAQSVGQVGRPGSLFADGDGVRRDEEYPPAVTVRPRPRPSHQGPDHASTDVPAREEGWPNPKVTTSRRPFVKLAQQKSTSAGPAPTRPPYASITIPESVSIQQTLRILPKEGNDDAGSQKKLVSTTAFRRPSSQPSSRPGVAPRPRPAPVLPNRPRPRPSTRPSSRPIPSSTEYHTEVSTSEIRKESQTRPDSSQLPEPAGGVNRLGIAFVTRPTTRRPLPAPTAPTTQRVVVVNAASAGGDVRPVRGDLRPTKPGSQLATSYQGAYQPIRSRPAPVFGSNTQSPSPSQQVQPQSAWNDDQPGDDDGDTDSAEAVVVSPQPETSAAAQSPEPLLSTGVSSVLAGALGGAMSGAPDGPSAPGDASAPSREQLLNLFRLIALRYPALVANMDQQQLQLLLNNEAARRKLLAPFLGNDKSRTPGEPQRTNTKLLELANISINSTRVNRQQNGRALRREVAGGALSNSPPHAPPRRPFVSRLSSSVLRALANFTRVKVAGGTAESPRPRPVTAAAHGPATGRPQSGPPGSLSDRLHQLVGFPTRAPPRGGNVTTNSSSRGKLSHKLMRFHGERTNPDGGEYDRAPLFPALRGTTGVPPLSERRNLVRHATRLPNSSPVHVIHYHEGESVQDILDKIFARFQQKPGQNEVKTVAQKPWAGMGVTLQSVAVNGQNSLATGRPKTNAAQPSFSASETVAAITTQSQPSASSSPPASTYAHEPTEGSSEPSNGTSKLPEVTSKPAEGSSGPAEVAEEADNEIGTAHLQGGATGIQPSARPTLASLLNNQTVASECRLPLIPNSSVASNFSLHGFHLPYYRPASASLSLLQPMNIFTYTYGKMQSSVADSLIFFIFSCCLIAPLVSNNFTSTLLSHLCRHSLYLFILTISP